MTAEQLAEFVHRTWPPPPGSDALYAAVRTFCRWHFPTAGVASLNLYLTAAAACEQEAADRGLNYTPEIVVKVVVVPLHDPDNTLPSDIRALSAPVMLLACIDFIRAAVPPCYRADLLVAKGCEMIPDEHWHLGRFAYLTDRMAVFHVLGDPDEGRRR